MLRRTKESGDTLIEVLFAVSVFSLVAVGALVIMNQGTSISERALETTLVRQAINGQAETLRFLHDSYIATYRTSQSSSSDSSDTPTAQWKAMLQSVEATGTVSASSFGANVSTCPTPPSGSFIFDTYNAKFISPSDNKLQRAETYSMLEYDTSGSDSSLEVARGIWIEAVRSRTNSGDPYQSKIGFIDFHIRACWFSPGQSVPSTLGTIVRLYEPR